MIGRPYDPLQDCPLSFHSVQRLRAGADGGAQHSGSAACMHMCLLYHVGIGCSYMSIGLSCRVPHGTPASRGFQAMCTTRIRSEFYAATHPPLPPTARHAHRQRFPWPERLVGLTPAVKHKKYRSLELEMMQSIPELDVLCRAYRSVTIMSAI